MKLSVTTFIGSVAIMGITTAVSAIPAQAKIKEIKLHFTQTQLDNPPAIEMHFKNGNWVWQNQSAAYKTRAKIKIRAKTWRVSNAKLVAYNVNKTKLVDTLWQWPLNYKAYKYEKLVTVNVGKKLLGAQKHSAAALCNTFGGDKKVIRTMNVPAELQAIATSGGWKYKKANLPVKVICMPKTNPTRKPVEFNISELKLYTVPAKPVCGKPVSLIAKFKTNKPGTIKFTLHRKDGNKQNVKVTTHKVGNGHGVSWSKKYTLTKSVSRNYMVVAEYPLAATPWVPLKVSCGVGADASTANTLSN